MLRDKELICEATEVKRPWNGNEINMWVSIFVCLNIFPLVVFITKA